MYSRNCKTQKVKNNIPLSELDRRSFNKKAHLLISLGKIHHTDVILEHVYCIISVFVTLRVYIVLVLKAVLQKSTLKNENWYFKAISPLLHSY